MSANQAEAGMGPTTAPQPRQSSRPSWSFWVGLAVVLGATGYIVTSSMANTVHYYDVDELGERPDLVGQSFRLRGEVVDGSHRVRTGTLDEHVFLLGVNQRVVTVLYQGAVPDQFRDGASVIATGRLVDGETFEADTITAQCPSRYENAAPTAAENAILNPSAAPAVDSPSPAAPAGPYLQPAEQAAPETAP